jgi:phage-related baseplate assembly protein
MTYAPNIIDLSRVPFPDAIETLSVETLLAQFIARFKTLWDAERIKDPTLPAWDVDPLEVDPVIVIGQAWAWYRMLDRQRVNDAVKSVFAVTAKGTNLANIAARVNVERKLIRAAVDDKLAIYESDAALLRRYLMSFDRPSAGSRDRYLFEAWSAWPQGEDLEGNPIGMGDCRINGWAIHKRRGDTHIVVMGPAGRTPTSGELAVIRAAVLSDYVKPEATFVSVIAAKRAVYSARFSIDVPFGPDVELVRQETVARIRRATDARTFINAQIPANYLSSAVYGANVLEARDLNPVEIEADPYTAPVCIGIEVTASVVDPE